MPGEDKKPIIVIDNIEYTEDQLTEQQAVIDATLQEVKGFS